MCQTGRRLWWVLAGFAAGVVVTALVAWLWLRSDSADPVDVADVVERYRASTTDAPTPIVDASVTPGVYVYRTSGSERVDALGGSTHDYPEQTTITVTHDEPCARLRWDALSQRWDEFVVCRGEDGWALAGFTTFHSFFRQDEERRFTCEPGSLYLPASPSPGEKFWARCTSEGSGHSGASNEVVTGEVVGLESITIDGRTVPAVRVRYDTVVGGTSTGDATVERWFAADGPMLLLQERRQARNTSGTALGDVHYEEGYELTLLRTEPTE